MYEKTMYAVEFSAQSLRDAYANKLRFHEVRLVKDEEGIYFDFGSSKVGQMNKDLGGEEFEYDVPNEFFEEIPNANLVRVVITRDTIRIAGIVEGGKKH